ncbi:unnamed protein product [Rhizophagus irregularis]|uniref:Uncharacterized protein n=1 Tax=Rhizophagus irregularis TaxID=588596 RepID=A0A915ZH92_9GLOM|nr:unnamed protein product [Rhizophagus irregularis]CAB5358837.1 unnamed protein product [Rhizophagus irregularis]CAB5374405.1 unnamed protein product [Rhizophagus irregularis]
MVRLVTLTLLLALITLVSSQSVSVLNTPSGPITQGAKVLVTWETIAPATQPGVLSAIAKSTQNTTVLSDNIDINAKSFDWVVNVIPDTYSLALNDGSGNKFSGPVEVIAAKNPQSPKTPAKAPAGGASPPPPPPPPAAKGKLVRRAPQNSAPTQSPAAKSSSTSTKSAFDLLLSLMTVAIIMVHSA